MRRLSRLERIAAAFALLVAFSLVVVSESTPASAAVTCSGSENTTWTGAVDSDWNTAGNWSNGVPDSSKTVCVASGTGNDPVIALAAASAQSVKVATGAILTVSSARTLTLTAASTIASLDVKTGATVTTGAVLTVDGDFSLANGTINGAGSLVTNGDAYLTGTSNTHTIAVNWQAVGGVAWYGGSIDNTGATISFTGSGTLDASILTGNPTLTSNDIIFSGAGYAYIKAATINSPIHISQGWVYLANSTVNGNVTQTGGRFGTADDYSNPSVKTLTINGNYSQTNAQLLLSANGTGTAGTNYDKFIVNGTYTIAGSSTLLFLGTNSYAGVIGNSFSPIAATSLTGTYATKSPSFSNSAITTLNVSYNSTGITAVLAGTVTTGTITGTARIDTNGDGTLAGGETTPLAGVTVLADANSNGTLDSGEDQDTTNGSGAYSLTVDPGTYTLRMVAPGGYVSTTTQISGVTVTSGNTSANHNAGFFGYNIATGMVFDDVNGNGVQDSGEAGLSGVTVYDDLDNNGALNSEPSTTTDNAGTYSLASMVKFNNPHHIRVEPGSRSLTSTVAPITVTASGASFTRDIGLRNAPPPQDPPSLGTGYWMIGENGDVYSYGNSANLGSPSSLPSLAAPIVGITANPAGGGYWAVGADGGVFSYGSSPFLGSMGGQPMNAPVVQLASTPTGSGYWLVGADGGVFSYGDAVFHGSASGVSNAGVSSIASTPDGNGYWVVAKDGGVFAYGNAQFYGSLGGQPLSAPIVGIATTATGRGYWLVGADGGVFCFGDAQFHGSGADLHLSQPIVSIRAKADGSGYVLIARDGGVFAFGTNQFLGAPTGAITSPVAQ
jgi:hypothetical protein